MAQLLLFQFAVSLLKAFFTHSKQKEVKSSAQIFNWSDMQDWIYDCRFCNLKGCNLAICLGIYAGIFHMPRIIAKVAYSYMCLLQHHPSSVLYQNHSFPFLLRKSTTVVSLYTSTRIQVLIVCVITSVTDHFRNSVWHSADNTFMISPTTVKSIVIDIASWVAFS